MSVKRSIAQGVFIGSLIGLSIVGVAEVADGATIAPAPTRTSPIGGPAPTQGSSPSYPPIAPRPASAVSPAPTQGSSPSYPTIAPRPTAGSVKALPVRASRCGR